jgi:hypothetical protein
MNKGTALVGAALAVVAVVLLIVLSSGEDNSGDTANTDTVASEVKGGGGKNDAGTGEAKPEVPTIVVGKDGKPVGGIAELTYQQGEQIHFKVEVPFAEEIHLHGYDVMKEVPEGGGTVTYDLPAEIEGIFEAELEGRGEQILELKVEP